MSEKVFAFLLHLYPSHFRNRYFQESMLLYRDRFKNETGLCRRARLWWDLFADLVVSLPEAWRTTPSVALPSKASLVTIQPAFDLLCEEPIRPKVILLSGTVSLGLILTFIFILNTLLLHPIHPDKMSSIETVMHNISKQESPKEQSNIQSKAKVALDANAASALLIHKEEPACQRDSGSVRGTGLVVIAITIGRTGMVSSTQALSGPKELRQLAVATARKYSYHPYLVNNSPVEVDTTVSIPIDCFSNDRRE